MLGKIAREWRVSDPHEGARELTSSILRQLGHSVDHPVYLLGGRWRGHWKFQCKHRTCRKFIHVIGREDRHIFRHSDYQSDPTDVLRVPRYRIIFGAFRGVKLKGFPQIDLDIYDYLNLNFEDRECSPSPNDLRMAARSDDVRCRYVTWVDYILDVKRLRKDLYHPYYLCKRLVNLT